MPMTGARRRKQGARVQDAPLCQQQMLAGAAHYPALADPESLSFSPTPSNRVKGVGEKLDGNQKLKTKRRVSPMSPVFVFTMSPASQEGGPLSASPPRARDSNDFRK
jgi:hypothetical protein